MSKEPGFRPRGAEWLADLTAGDLTSAQKAGLADWLRESPLHVRELLEHTLLHHDLAALRFTPAQVEARVREACGTANEPLPFHEAGAARERTVVPVPEPGTPAERPRTGTPRGKRLAIAASLLVVLAGLAAFVKWQDGRYTTGRGEQRILSLSDGSVVTLNTGSVLKLRFSARHRALELVKGEAFFRVARDSTRPFEVTAQGATVKALGTEFNVRIAPAGTIVSVVDGTVEVRMDLKADAAPGAGEHDRLRLTKGEEARIPHPVARGAELSPVMDKQGVPTAAARATAWTQGRVDFDAVPLIGVLGEFQRYRDFSVDVEDESIRQLRLTGSFDANDPASALAYIDTLPGIVVEQDGERRYVIRRR